VTTIHADPLLTWQDLHRFGEAARAEAVLWIEAHGFGSHTFQVQYDLVDCPLIRVWWLTHDEVTAIPDDELSAAGGDIIPFAHIEEVVLRHPLPSWWQPL
jgi:hypothetical protein